MKILVLGASGMAGHLVSSYLIEQDYDVDTLSGKNKFDLNTTILDLTHSEAFEYYLKSHTYDAIINCVGILVNQSDERKDLASYLNGYLPHYLEHKYKDSTTKIIHISTDCVFSGKNAPYDEHSPYDGTSFYDRSKALGEINNAKDLTFRMSIIGPEIIETGTGLFHWFMTQSSTIQGYTNVFWNGVSTLELAKGIDAALKQNLTGIYHFVPDINISKYDLLSLINKEFKRNVTIEPKSTEIIDKTLINTRKDFNYIISNYVKMVGDLHEWIDKHKKLYHY